MKSGFSKLTKEEKINWVVNKLFFNNIEAKKLLEQYHLSNSELQKIHDDFSENTLSHSFFTLTEANTVFKTVLDCILLKY